MIDQYRYVMAFPPYLAHPFILLLFAASCGEMPSFDYNRVNLSQEPEIEKERFVEIGRVSFFRDYLYDIIVPEGHFLRILKPITGGLS